MSPFYIKAFYKSEERTSSSLMPVKDANSSMVIKPVLGLFSCLRMEESSLRAALGPRPVMMVTSFA